MARQKEGKEQIRKVQRSKGTYYVSLPLVLVRKLKLRERQKVVVRKFGKSIRITDWQKKK
jgi:hypothetical protein